MVVDEGGRPLADVEVILTREGSQPLATRTYADGRFEFKEVPDEGDVQLEIKTPGYEVRKISYAEGEDRSSEVVLYPALPAGQVRGAVLDLSGNPVAAKITITPGDHEVDVKEDGSFELELTPGRYTVRFHHADYKNQMRVVVVEDRGVVILNIALSP
jgi:5-hydroxyisourate hydrolase-like protein (transthyretin family)